jgi:hypothetical protein
VQRRSGNGEAGAASVEHVAMVMLVALLFAAAIAALASAPPLLAGRELAATIGRRIVCAPRLPGPCRRNPLFVAYGEPLGKLVRALAPVPAARAATSGLPLIPVDFRRCRRSSCAVAQAGRPDLTSAYRRRTLFTSVRDGRHAGDGIEVTYWAYRPGLGWDSAVRRGDDTSIGAAGGLRLRRTDDPVLVPLETLPGRDHYSFGAGERPPWQWRVHSTYPD